MSGRRSVPRITIVTGASGWLGRALLAVLGDRDADTGLASRVRALVLNASAVCTLGVPSGRVEICVGDLADARVLDSLLRDGEGADIIHCAGVIHPRRVREFDETNVAGTAALVEAARRAHVRRFVHVSSNSPFGANPTTTDSFRAEEPFNPYMAYGRSKMHAEMIVREADGTGLETTIVRPPWFYGPYQPARQTRFLRAVRRGRFPCFGDGRNRRSMVYVENLVDGIFCAELEPQAAGRAYWIADRRPYEMSEIVSTTRRALVREGLLVTHSTPRFPGMFADWAERADAAVQRSGRYIQALHVLGEMNKTIACDISRAEQELGYTPRVDLYEGMRKSVRWCLEQGIAL
jgi:nucleoside-diphosphate-sugar epimerase